MRCNIPNMGVCSNAGFDSLTMGVYVGVFVYGGVKYAFACVYMCLCVMAELMWQGRCNAES